MLDAGAREELAEKAADGLPPVGELASKAGIAGIRAEFAGIRKDLATLKADLTLRVVIIVGIIVGVSNAILLAVLRLTPG